MDSNARRGFDFIGVSAVALVHDGQGNILLQQRGPQARDEHGAWDLCGGAVEFGDSLEDTVMKELQEELCVEPQSITFLTAYDAHRVIDNRPSHWVALVFAVQVDRNKVSVGEPHKVAQIGWFTSQNLPEPRHSQFDKSFSAAMAQGIIS